MKCKLITIVLFLSIFAFAEEDKSRSVNEVNNLIEKIKGFNVDVRLSPNDYYFIGFSKGTDSDGKIIATPLDYGKFETESSDGKIKFSKMDINIRIPYMRLSGVTLQSTFSISRNTETFPSCDGDMKLHGVLRSKATFNITINGEQQDVLGANCEWFSTLFGMNQIFSLAEGKVVRIVYPLYSKDRVSRNIEVFIAKDAETLKKLISIGRDWNF